MLGVLCLMISFAPMSVRASSLFITEVMYDYPGTETVGNQSNAHDWIEVYNAGSDSVDLAGSKFRFAVGGSGHLVTSYNNSNTVLAPGGIAIIANLPAQFLLDFPSVAAPVLDSSFGLTDTVTALELKLTDGTSFDAISYTPQSTASNGGDSLHRSGTVFAVGAPTPGVLSEQLGTQQDPTPDTSSGDTTTTTPQTSNQTQTNGAISNPAPLMSVDAGGDRTVESGAGSFFEGHVYNKEDVPLTGAHYLWNFGNGEMREGQSVFYAYPYPGTYAVILTVDAGNGYSTTARVVVQAVPAEVKIEQGSDGSVIITNTTHAKKDLDLGIWKIERGGSTFTLPRGTVVLPGIAVHIAPSVLKLPPANTVLLLYPDGMVAAEAGILDDVHAAGITFEPAAATKETAVSVAVPAPTKSARAPAVVTPPDPVFATDTATNSVAAVSVTSASHDLPPLVLPIAGAAAVTLLGISAAVSLRPSASTQAGTETHEEEEEFNEDDLESPDPEETIRRADRLARKFTLHAKK